MSTAMDVNETCGLKLFSLKHEDLETKTTNYFLSYKKSL